MFEKSLWTTGNLRRDPKMGFESQDKMFPYQQKVLVNAIPFQ